MLYDPEHWEEIHGNKEKETAEARNTQDEMVE